MDNIKKRFSIKEEGGANLGLIKADIDDIIDLEGIKRDILSIWE